MSYCFRSSSLVKINLVFNSLDNCIILAQNKARRSLWYCLGKAEVYVLAINLYFLKLYLFLETQHSTEKFYQDFHLSTAHYFFTQAIYTGHCETCAGLPNCTCSSGGVHDLNSP